jgi:hypothetical protein
VLWTSSGSLTTPGVLPFTNSRVYSCNNSMRRQCADKPSGCAESSCSKHSAHPLGLSAHLERRKLLAFLCGCGHLRRSDPVGSPSYHQLTNFHTSMPQRRIIIPSGCAKTACLEHSAHPLGLSAHLKMQTLLAFLCLTPGVLPSTITSSRTISYSKRMR